MELNERMLARLIINNQRWTFVEIEWTVMLSPSRCSRAPHLISALIDMLSSHMQSLVGKLGDMAISGTNICWAEQTTGIVLHYQNLCIWFLLVQFMNRMDSDNFWDTVIKTFKYIFPQVSTHWISEPRHGADFGEKIASLTPSFRNVPWV